MDLSAGVDSQVPPDADELRKFGQEQFVSPALSQQHNCDPWLYRAIIVFTSLGGFAFAKYEFPGGRDALFIVVLGTLMIPTEVILIPPLFIVMAKIGWVDSYLSLIIPFSANAFGIFMMRQTMGNIPMDLLDAGGRIDGCTEFQLYRKIALPAVKGGLCALAVLSFLTSWNDFLWPP